MQENRMIIIKCMMIETEKKMKRTGDGEGSMKNLQISNKERSMTTTSKS
jgi:hypothetical protein